MGEYYITKKYTNKAQREIEERKLQHISIPLEKDVEARSATTLLEDVHLIHQALPELNFDSSALTPSFVARLPTDAEVYANPPAPISIATIATDSEALSTFIVKDYSSISTI